MTVYIAVLYDRHVDPSMEVFDSLDAANHRLKTWMDLYGDLYQWEKQVFQGPLKPERPIWLSHYRTDVDEGPTVHIEEKELHSLKPDKAKVPDSETIEVGDRVMVCWGRSQGYAKLEGWVLELPSLNRRGMAIREKRTGAIHHVERYELVELLEKGR